MKSSLKLFAISLQTSLTLRPATEFERRRPTPATGRGGGNFEPF